MPICSNPVCRHPVGGKITVCPDCGTATPHLARVADYEILRCVADTRTATIYQAQRNGASGTLCLRLYNADVTLTNDQSNALRQRFESLRELPAERFIHTLDFGYDAATGCWYRLTPWQADVQAWGDFKSQALVGDNERKRQWLALALELAESFHELHQLGRIIPDFTLDDCLLYRSTDNNPHVRLDATLASCLGPGSGREKVRGSHPDFSPNHALSEQSDVWTLGAILVTMLAGTNKIDDFAQVMDTINAERRPVAIHPKLGQLLRQMVDTDPAERPHNMKAVCARLGEFGPAQIAEWDALERDSGKHARLVWRMAAIAAAAVGMAAIITVTLNQHKADEIISEVKALIPDGKGFIDAEALTDVKQMLDQIRASAPDVRDQAILTRYSRAVAFVLTEIWFEINGVRQTHSWSSGTAFLVTTDGYLLSNRHVVAPWIAGETAEGVEQIIAQLRQTGKVFRFGVTHRLWFDGDEAFRPAHTARVTSSADTADIFRLDTAYTSDDSTAQKLHVAGVMPKPVDPADFLISTLEDDVAILKIESVPANAVPIPLRTGQPPSRGADVLALGYSRGREAIPGTRAEARCSKGTVSGAPGDVITIDADLQPGNSGGPVLDADGYAIGIASALFGNENALQTGMGRVLPIDIARRFLETIRAGSPAWDGLPNAAFEPELLAANRAAESGDWQTASGFASIEGVLNNPDLAVLAAVFAMDKTGFTPVGRNALERVSLIAPHAPLIALLRYWDAWQQGLQERKRPFRQELINAEWFSPFEPYGQVVRVLEGTLRLEEAAPRAESADEFALLHWAAGTAAARADHIGEAALLLREGIKQRKPVN